MNIIILVMAFAGELVDSSLGMMYGTLLSPILIIMGYDAKLVVPSILISQGLGGLVATIFHDRLGNGQFKGYTKDTKIALSVIIPGLLATGAGVFVASIISKFALNMYIGVLVVIMGLLVIFPIMYKFDWKKIWAIGALSGFNKAMSGGGFGPVTSTGKILGGVDAKVSVATTTYAEVPICLFGFALWIAFNGWLAWELPVFLCLGAIVGGLIGPFITKKFNSTILRYSIGILAIVSGIWIIYKLF
jgi:hypothetical protein